MPHLGRASSRGHTRCVWWWIVGAAVLLWVALSVPLAILIGKAARLKDLREPPAPPSEDGRNDPPDCTVA